MTTDTDKASDKLVEMALKAAFEKGWCAAAQWAQRDDLRHDTGSIAYAGQRDAILAGKAAEVRAAIIADLCGDVEPVAWMGVSGVGERIVSKTQMYPFMTTPLYPAHTVAALAARVAELEKDAGRYRWLRDGELTADYPYPVMRMGGSRVDDQTIWNDELDAAIDAAMAKD